MHALFSQLQLGWYTFSLAKNWLECLLFHVDFDTKQQMTVHLRNGQSIVVRKKSGDMMAVVEDFYEQQYVHFNLKLPENAVILDVGAHIGTFSMVMQQFHPKSIIAVEPLAANIEQVKQNIQINALTTVFTHRAALWIKNGKMTIHMQGMILWELL